MRSVTKFKIEIRFLKHVITNIKTLPTTYRVNGIYVFHTTVFIPVAFKGIFSLLNFRTRVQVFHGHTTFILKKIMSRVNQFENRCTYIYFNKTSM